MRSTHSLVSGRPLLGLCITWLCCLSLSAHGQVRGNNGVYNTSGVVVGSGDFVDVSAYDTLATDDICTKLNGALNSLSKGGTVVDARGINVSNTKNDGSGHLTCASNPWNSITKPSKVLLPAGVIIIQTTWIVVDQTEVSGEGPGETTIQAQSGLISPMLVMGSVGCPTGGTFFHVQISHLTLDAQGQAIDAIDNCGAQEQSLVDDVTIHGVSGTGSGLYIDTGAGHSGPYTNIVFDCSSGCGSQAGTCVNLPPVTGPTFAQPQPRGFHGLSCIGNSGTGDAILLDGSNISFEGVTISNFSDGILIGSRNTTIEPIENNLFFNISGSSNHTLIHIANQSSANLVNSLTLLGLSSSSSTFTVEDELTNTTLSDANIGMYILGHAVGGGYSRFTTSPNEPTWGVGSSPLGVGLSQSCTRNGALYSNSGTSTAGTLWACVGLSWSKIK